MTDNNKPTESDGPTKRGETQWSQVAQEGPAAPKQPNERDESASSQTGESLPTDPHARAAFQDAAGPQQDTGRQPVTDKVYNESVTEGDRTAVTKK